MFVRWWWWGGGRGLAVCQVELSLVGVGVWKSLVIDLLSH